MSLRLFFFFSQTVALIGSTGCATRGEPVRATPPDLSTSVDASREELPEPTLGSALATTPLQFVTAIPEACRALRKLLAPPPEPGTPGMAIRTMAKDCARLPQANLASTVEVLAVTISQEVPAHMATEPAAPSASAQSVALAPLFASPNGWLVATQAAVVAHPATTMTRLEDGAVAVGASTSVDLVGDVAPELVFTFQQSQPTCAWGFVVCDAAGAWCTKPEMLQTDDCSADAAAHVATEFRRHPRGVVVRRASGGAFVHALSAQPAPTAAPLTPRARAERRVLDVQGDVHAAVVDLR